MRLIAYAIVAVLLGGAGCTLETGDPAGSTEGTTLDRQTGAASKLPVDSPPIQRELIVANESTADNPEPSPWHPPPAGGTTTETSQQQSQSSTAAKARNVSSDNGVHIITRFGETDL
jgi:hypothetical protein